MKSEFLKREISDRNFANFTAPINYKEYQMLLPAVYIPVQDLNSSARAPRLVDYSKKVIFTSVTSFSFRFLEHHSLEMP